MEESGLKINVEHRENMKHLDHSAEKSLNETKHFCKEVIKGRVGKGRFKIVEYLKCQVNNLELYPEDRQLNVIKT